MNERVQASYLIETAYPLADAAEIMAGEQSSGTFVPVPGETPELKALAAARVERIEELAPAASPSLPGAGIPKGLAQPVWRRARVVLSWPLSNMGPDLPMLLATVAGNLFELKQFSGLRLLDVVLPDAFARAPTKYSSVCFAGDFENDDYGQKIKTFCSFSSLLLSKPSNLLGDYSCKSPGRTDTYYGKKFRAVTEQAIVKPT